MLERQDQERSVGNDKPTKDHWQEALPKEARRSFSSATIVSFNLY
jgi:hypothetical protein